jgi:hypothetical protein
MINSAYAHEGPPYPILVDHPLKQGKLSIWSDPDVGAGTFHFYLEDSSNLKINISASLGKESVSSLVNADHTAVLPFPQEGLWTVKVRILTLDGGSHRSNS